MVERLQRTKRCS